MKYQGGNERNAKYKRAGEQDREPQDNDGEDVRKKEVRTPTVLKEPNEG